MKIIGLTGGIGSGKTTVSQIFAEMGVPVFCCDDVARKIQDTDPRAISGMKRLLGNDIYADDGTLLRKKVASIAFADPNMLAALNSLIHPLVHEAFEQFAADHASRPLILMESAILVQSGFYKKADFCVLVTAPIGTRIVRVMRRDQATIEQVFARIDSQMPDSEIANYCKYQIVNENLAEVRLQVEEIVTKETIC